MLNDVWLSSPSGSGAAIGVGSGVAVDSLADEGAGLVAARAVGSPVGSRVGSIEEQAANASSRAASPINQKPLLCTKAPRCPGGERPRTWLRGKMTVYVCQSDVSLRIDN